MNLKGIKGFFAGWIVFTTLGAVIAGCLGLASYGLAEYVPDKYNINIPPGFKLVEAAPDRSNCWRNVNGDRCVTDRTAYLVTGEILEIPLGAFMGYPIVYAIIISFSYVLGLKKP